MINEFQVYSPTPGHIKVDVNVTDDSGGSVVCIAYLYWVFDLGDELDSYSIELADGSEVSRSATWIQNERTLLSSTSGTRREMRATTTARGTLTERGSKTSE